MSVTKYRARTPIGVFRRSPLGVFMRGFGVKNIALTYFMYAWNGTAEQWLHGLRSFSHYNTNNCSFTVCAVGVAEEGLYPPGQPPPPASINFATMEDPLVLGPTQNLVSWTNSQAETPLEAFWILADPQVITNNPLWYIDITSWAQGLGDGNSSGFAAPLWLDDISVWCGFYQTE